VIRDSRPMATIRIVSTSVSPLVIPAMLERARTALDLGQPTVGRAFVDDAIQRLAQAKAAQDTVLDDEARTLEAPGTSLDLAAGES
jgi:predicted kinase